MPGFTAERGLGPARGRYAGLSAHAVSSCDGGVTLQGWPLPNPGGLWPPPVFPNGVPYNPIGTWPTRPPPGWGLPPPPPPPPPPPVGPGAGALGGSILTKPIHLGLGGTVAVAAGAVAAGIGLGYVIGKGVSAGVTPELPPPLVPTGCTPVGPNTQHQITKTYWSCERGYNQTQIDADNDCKGRAGRCQGTCPSGVPCSPYASVWDVVQVPGFFSCDTTVYYTCQCGC